MDKPDTQKDDSPALPIQDRDSGKSNHDHTLELLRDAGYEVAYKIVNPLDVGVPQSRPRIHYQGINKRKFPGLNTRLAMECLMDTWTRLIKSFAAIEVPMMLEDFLLLADDIPTEAENPSPDESQSPPPTKRQKAFKWQTLHADFKKQHGATRQKDHSDSEEPFFSKLEFTMCTLGFSL